MDKSITLCDRCDIYMSCLLNYDGPACRRNRTVEPTHADHVRAMSDEELAEFLTIIEVKCYQRLGYESDVERFKTQWLEWLKKETYDE